MACALVIGFIFSYGLTAYIYRRAWAYNQLDIPNHRSSHHRPTPRGGGVSFVVGFIVLMLYLMMAKTLSPSSAIVYGIGGSIVAGIGWLDDHHHVKTLSRLIGHFVAASIVLISLGSMPSIQSYFWTIPAGVWTNTLAIIGLVWFINLYNFMDGLDGLAAVETLCVCLGGACLYWLHGEYSHMILPLLLSTTVAGFLCWNIPPAKIFMGDIGSGFLGLMIGTMSLQAAYFNMAMFWSWMILSGIFIVDTAVTLLRRALQGDKIYEAHCSHAYQHAAQRINSHFGVVLTVLLINIFWLCPIAYIVAQGYLDGFIGLMVAYLPLIILAVQLNAGKK